MPITLSRLPGQGHLGRPVVVRAIRVDSQRRGSLIVDGLDTDHRLLEPEPTREDPFRNKLEFLSETSADIADRASVVLNQYAPGAIAIRKILKGLPFLLHIVHEEADIAS